MDKDEFTRYLTTFKHYSSKKVKSIELNISAENVDKGNIRITDIQLQEGMQATGEIPATQDILELTRFNIDESHNATTYENVYLGDQPQTFFHLEERFFNVMGRGFETITIPNVYHEDYRIPILTTGLDLTLYPKNDYDFLRITSFYGGFIENQYDRTYTDETLEKNPLNYRYTREFCFPGGKIGDEIILSAAKQRASVNGKVIGLGVQKFNVGQSSDYDGIKPVYYRNRQRFMLLPVGATRINIQFMKKEQTGNLIYMVDAGIGFHGIAEFKQWTWGVSKI
ncbi:hypothetical protein JOC94_004224 [Bacillus thermophilus]|uniref:Uncharacterized protein n=2 Tax=Siminovitchia thermophila TaxID=1245522 RepID=A0ABS2RDC9_9BACI|nr:hypothetical protein [Siminovitchia thermophila]